MRYTKEQAEKTYGRAYELLSKGLRVAEVAEVMTSEGYQNAKGSAIDTNWVRNNHNRINKIAGAKTKGKRAKKRETFRYEDTIAGRTDTRNVAGANTQPSSFIFETISRTDLNDKQKVELVRTFLSFA